MPVTTQELDEIGRALAECGPQGAVVGILRGRYPHLAWTQCDASDVVEAPFAIVPSYDLHLIDTRSHCPQITSDLAEATGIVLARRSAVA